MVDATSYLDIQTSTAQTMDTHVSYSPVLWLNKTGACFQFGAASVVVPSDYSNRSSLISDLNCKSEKEVRVPIPLSITEVEAWLECARCIATDAKVALNEHHDDKTLVSSLRVWFDHFDVHCHPSAPQCVRMASLFVDSVSLNPLLKRCASLRESQRGSSIRLGIWSLSVCWSLSDGRVS